MVGALNSKVVVCCWIYCAVVLSQSVYYFAVDCSALSKLWTQYVPTIVFAFLDVSISRYVYHHIYWFSMVLQVCWLFFFYGFTARIRHNNITVMSTFFLLFKIQYIYLCRVFSLGLVAWKPVSIFQKYMFYSLY